MHDVRLTALVLEGTPALWLDELRRHTCRPEKLSVRHVALGEDIEALALQALNRSDATIAGLVISTVTVPELWDLRLFWTLTDHSSATSASAWVHRTDGAAADGTAALDRRLAGVAGGVVVEAPALLPDCCMVRTQAFRATPEASLAMASREERRKGRTHLIAGDVAALRMGHQEVLANRLQEDPSILNHSRRRPLAAARHQARVAAAPAKPVAERLKPRVLHLSSPWAGGAAAWMRSFAEGAPDHVHLEARPLGPSGRFSGLALRTVGDAAGPFEEYRLTLPIKATDVHNMGYRDALARLIAEWGVEAIIVSSLFGHSLDALDTGLPTTLVWHDFYPLAPDLFLPCVPDREQSGLAGDLIARTFAQGGFRAAANRGRGEAEAVARAFRHRLSRGDLPVVAPSQAARRLIRDLMPEVPAEAVLHVPHGLGSIFRDALPVPPPDDGERLRVVVLSRLTPEKGAGIIAGSLDALASFCDLHLVGAGRDGERFADFPNVSVVMSYAPEDLPELVRSLRPHVGLIASATPETFCYALHELRALGVPPLATNLGAQAEAIDDGRTGFLCAPSSEAVVEALQRLHGDRGALRRVHGALVEEKKIPAWTPQDMAAAYAAHLPPPGPSRRARSARDIPLHAASGMGASAESPWVRLAGPFLFAGGTAVTAEHPALRGARSLRLSAHVVVDEVPEGTPPAAMMRLAVASPADAAALSVMVDAAAGTAHARLMVTDTFGGQDHYDVVAPLAIGRPARLAVTFCMAEGVLEVLVDGVSAGCAALPEGAAASFDSIVVGSRAFRGTLGEVEVGPL